MVCFDKKRAKETKLHFDQIDLRQISEIAQFDRLTKFERQQQKMKMMMKVHLGK